MIEKTDVPINSKYALTLPEASAYFGIGQRSLKQIIVNNMDKGLAILIGRKLLIKREKFAIFLDESIDVIRLNQEI